MFGICQIESRKAKNNAEGGGGGGGGVKFLHFDSIALRKAKIVCNFSLSECNRVKEY